MSLDTTATIGRRSEAIAWSRSLPELAAGALTLAGALLLVLGLAGATLRLDGYGLVRSLPPAYFVGLVCLPLAGLVVVTRPRSAPLLVAGLLVFVLAVWATPLVLEGTPRFRTGFLSYGYVDPIVRGEGLDPARFYYHNWPLFPLAMGALVSVTGLAPTALLAWFPTAIVLAYLVPLAGLLRLATAPIRDRVPGAWAAGLWLFVVFDWTNQDYFSPQAVAYLFFLTFAWLVAWVALRRDGRFTGTTVAVALGLYALIVLTHVLTALLALGVLIALTLGRLLHRPSLVVTCAVLFFGWQAYVATPFYASYGPHLLAAIASIGDFFVLNLTNRINGSPEHEAVARLRVLSTALVFGLGGLAFLRAVAARRLTRELRLGVLLLAGIAIVAPVSVYGGEMLIRVLLFSLPVLALLVAWALDVRLFRFVLAGALLVATPLHLVTHFGNEAYDHVSAGELAGFAYVAEHLAPANVYGAYPAADFQRTTRLDSRTIVPAGANYRLEVSSYTRPGDFYWRHEDWPIYVAVSRGDAAAADLFFDEPDHVARVLADLERDRDFVQVYRNRDIAIFLWKKGPTP